METYSLILKVDGFYLIEEKIKLELMRETEMINDRINFLECHTRGPQSTYEQSVIDLSKKMELFSNLCNYDLARWKDFFKIPLNEKELQVLEKHPKDDSLKPVLKEFYLNQLN